MRNRKSDTLLDVNISASTQFMDITLEQTVCVVLLYLHAKVWTNLRHGQKFV